MSGDDTSLRDSSYRAGATLNNSDWMHGSMTCGPCRKRPAGSAQRERERGVRERERERERQEGWPSQRGILPCSQNPRVKPGWYKILNQSN